MELSYAARIFILLILKDFVNAEAAIISQPCHTNTCEYTFSLTLGHTLTKVHSGGSHIQDLELHSGGCIKPTGSENDTPCLDIGSNEAASNIITGDGRKRAVFLINGVFPGPTIEVMEGATVIVNVQNHLSSTSTTIHWHGIRMAGSQWMDGPSNFAQCPIPPGHTFSYRFVATPSGTHWYHPHHENLRTDGHFGMIVVHKRQPTLPELPLIVTDWYEEGAQNYRPISFRQGYFGEQPMPVSTLINGRGRHIHSAPDAPLSVFHIEQGTNYRFRCVNAASDFGYEIKIDHHRLTIVAWDGAEIKPLVVDSFNIFPGERVDFTIDSVAAGAHSSWVRAIPLIGSVSSGSDGGSHSGNHGDAEHMGGEHGNGDHGHMGNEDSGMGHTDHNMMANEGAGHETNHTTEGMLPMASLETYAILSYGSHHDPISHPKPCTADSKCLKFNCHAAYPHSSNITCVKLEDVQVYDESLMEYLQGESPRQVFMNVATGIGASINALRYVPGQSSFYREDPLNLLSCHKYCGASHQSHEACWCSNGITFQYNELVHIIVTNFESPDHSASGHSAHHLHATGHPMHIHGHRFAVVAQGFAQIDPDTGETIGNNMAIRCESSLCKYPSWNPNHARPPMNFKNPPLKDSMNVPPGGFAVLRLRLDNPGYWLFHCHLLRDMLGGMAMYVRVAAEKVNPPAPQLPRCSPSSTGNSNIGPAIGDPHASNGNKQPSTIDLKAGELIGIILGSMVGGALLLSLAMLPILRRGCGGTARKEHIGPTTPLGFNGYNSRKLNTRF